MLNTILCAVLIVMCAITAIVLQRAVTLLRESVITWEMVETHFKQLVEDRADCNEAKYAYRNHARTLERQQKELAEIKDALTAEFRSERK